MNAETVLYGVWKGDESWKETILSTRPECFDGVKRLATEDGWGRFRIATIDLSVPPDFGAAIAKETP